MKRWMIRLIVLAVLAAGGVIAWLALFPGPEKVIRQRLLEVASLASFGSNEAPLAKFANVNKLLSYFTSDAVVVVDVAGRFQHRMRGRDELMQAAMGARNALMGLAVEFIDVTVKLSPDKKVAIVELTAKARAVGERDDMIQELRFTLRKIGGDWLIDRVETVKTLSLMTGI